jgi:hypothetical protein
MKPLVHQRCLNHADREAAARCPDCKRYFCRECVSEHEDRILCASCLRQLAAPQVRKRRNLTAVFQVVPCLLAIGITWFFFFLVGRGLLAIPDSFHKGTLWKTLEQEIE